MIDFSEDHRFELAENLIKPGNVLRLHSSQTNPPKVKYHVILGQDRNKIHFVFCNSVLRDYQKRRPELSNLNIEIHKGKETVFPELTYIDCARIYSENIQDMIKLLADDFSAHRGVLSSTSRKRILKAVENDEKVLSKIQKDLFLGLND